MIRKEIQPLNQIVVGKVTAPFCFLKPWSTLGYGMLSWSVNKSRNIMEVITFQHNNV